MGKLFALFGGNSVLNGKKTFGLNVISIVALAWALLSPGTAPTEGQLNDVVVQSKEVVQVVHQEVLPLIVVLVANVLGLFTGLHSQSKIGILIRTLSAYLGKYLDMDEAKKLHEQLVKGAEPIKAVPIQPKP